MVFKRNASLRIWRKAAGNVRYIFFGDGE